MLSSLDKLKGRLSPEDMQTIFGDKNMTVEKFNEQLKSNPHKFIKGELGTTKLKKITTGFQNKGSSEFDEVGKHMNQFNTGLNDYYTYTTNLEKWKKGSIQDVKNHVERTVGGELKGAVKFMFDEKGNPRSKEGFNNAMIKSGLVDKEDLVAYEGYKKYIKNKKENNKNTFTPYSPLSLIPGFGGIKAMEVLQGANKVRGEYMQETYNQYDPEVNPRVAKVLEKFNYDKLKKEIHDAYQSTDIKLTPPPGISALTDFKGAGLTTVGQQGITVYPNAYNSVGAANWNDFKNDIKNLDFDNDVTVKFLGAVKDGPNRVKEGKVLLQEMFNETAKHNSTFRGFRLAAQPIAENNSNRGAMVIYPDADWLKKHTYTKTENGKTAGTISQDQANYILQNGISFISDNKNWNNNLFQSTYTTPLEADINYNKKVTINDPNDDQGMNSATFEKDEVMGGYKYNFSYKFWNPNTGAYEKATTSTENLTNREQLEYVRSSAFNDWGSIEAMNNENFRSKK